MGRIWIVALFLAAMVFGCSMPAASGWQAVQLPMGSTYNGIWFTDSLNGWISGGAREVPGGLLGRTRDGGRTWTIRGNVVKRADPNFYLGQIQLRDSLRGCMVSDGGLVLLTDDGGTTWRTTHDMHYGTLMFLRFLDDHDGWALGPAAAIGTNDGGETWHELVRNQDQNHYLSGHAAVFTDSLRGWLLSHSGELMRTEDGGREWTSVPLPLPPQHARGQLLDITFVDPMHGWLVGELGTICRTRDGGVTWERQTNGVPVERVPRRGDKPPLRLERSEPSKLDLTAVRFADLERGFAVGIYGDFGESVILGTRDGGTTWTTEMVAPGQFLGALFVLDRRHAWVTGSRVRQLPQMLYRYTAAD